MDNNILSFIIFLSAIYLSRIISSKALKNLTPEKKLELIDLFSKNRNLTLGISFGIIILFLLNAQFKIVEFFTSFILYFLLLIVFMLVRSYSSYKKLKENNFPESYIKSNLIASAVIIVGIALFFISLRL